MVVAVVVVDGVEVNVDVNRRCCCHHCCHLLRHHRVTFSVHVSCNDSSFNGVKFTLATTTTTGAGNVVVIKTSVVERFNHMLKSKMFRYFTLKNTWCYIDMLQKLIDSYNDNHQSWHQTTSTRPTKLSYIHDCISARHLIIWCFELRDYVHMIASRQRTFARGYTSKWMHETFTICNCIPTNPPSYGLCDEMGEHIKGMYHAQEQHKVTPSLLHQMEKILHLQRVTDGKVWHYVSWRSYLKKFKSWIDKITSIDNHGIVGEWAAAAAATTTTSTTTTTTTVTVWREVEEEENYGIFDRVSDCHISTDIDCCTIVAIATKHSGIRWSMLDAAVLYQIPHWNAQTNATMSQFMIFCRATAQ